MIFREDLVKLEERFRSSDICVPPLLSGPFFVNDQSSIFPQIPAHSKSQFGREPGGDGNERQQDGVNHSYNSDNKPSNIVVSSPDIRRNETMETGQSKQASRYRSEDDNSAAEPSRG